MSEPDKITAGELLGGIAVVSETFARKGLGGLLQDVTDKAVQYGKESMNTARTELSGYITGVLDVSSDYDTEAALLTIRDWVDVGCPPGTLYEALERHNTAPDNTPELFTYEETTLSGKKIRYTAEEKRNGLD